MKGDTLKIDGSPEIDLISRAAEGLKDPGRVSANVRGK